MKIHQKVDEEPIDITGVMTCHWCESKQAKCIQTIGLFAFSGLCIGLGIMALLHGELHFCLMLFFVGSIPMFFLALFFIYVKVQKAKHSRRNTVQISAEGNEENLTDFLIANGIPNSVQGVGLEHQGHLHLPDRAPANDPPPEYEEAMGISESNVTNLGSEQNSLQTTIV